MIMKRFWMFLVAGLVVLATACDKEDDVPPTEQLDATTRSVLEGMYPTATIVDVDNYAEYTEVEILDGTTYRDLYFDKAGAWLRTETDVRLTDVPAAVTAAVAASPHATLPIDDVDWIESPTGNYYAVELDSNPDVYLKITAEGVIL